MPGADSSKASRGKILGIDLGTTNSVMAVWDGREPRILVNAEGARLTPSVVAFDATGDVLVGDVARRQAVPNASNTVYSVKRFMGRPWRAARSEMDRVAYKVEAGEDGQAAIVIGERNFKPAEISAHILRQLKQAAETFLGEPIVGAVITVPAYFNDAQRTATKEAGVLAGLDVRRIINEPTAAALAYGLDKEDESVIAVYDFGGGTFDVSVLTVDHKVIEVVANHGDTHLGGDDIDSRIVAWLITRFDEDTGVSLSEDFTALQRMREAAERAKIDLSTRSETEINLPFLAGQSGAPLHLQATLTREILEGLCADLVERTLDSCRQALIDAGKDVADIQEVVLVGGCSRMPIVQREVLRFFGKKPRRTVNPDEAVALGAAVQAGVIAGEIKGMVLLDVTSLSLGVETHDGRTAVVIPRNTTIPTAVARSFTTATDNQTSVEVHVVQGEAENAAENGSLGRFDLEGLRPAPAGSAHIEVSFEIDLNGIVQVHAHDQESGKAESISLSVTPGASRSTNPALPQEPALAGRHGTSDEWKPQTLDPHDTKGGLSGHAARSHR